MKENLKENKEKILGKIFLKGITVVFLISLITFLMSSAIIGAEPETVLTQIELFGDAIWDINPHQPSQTYDTMSSIVLYTANDYLGIIPQSGIKFSDLANLMSDDWSFWYFNDENATRE
ncbi:unnamed protein product, partial [marine sediment metagenome]